MGVSGPRGRRASRGRDNLLLRGVRWRLGASLLIVLTATVAVAAAVLGPLYLHTAGDSVVRRTVAQAPVQSRGVTLIPRTSQPPSAAAMQRAADLVRRTVGAGGRDESTITTLDAGASIPVPGDPAPATTGLLWRTDICGHLRMASGRCALGPQQTVITEALAQLVHAHVGSVLHPSLTSQTNLSLTVTGIAAPVDIASSYWWGGGASYFPSEARVATARVHDSLVVSPSTIATLPSGVLATTDKQIALRPDGIDLADDATVLHDLNRDAGVLRGENVVLSSLLPGLVSTADHQRHAMRTIVAIAAIQLVLLAVWVLVSVLVRSGDARRAEARVARLRGFSASSMLWVTAAEPGLLCGIGVVLGVAVAWLAVVIARADLLVGGSSVRFDLPAVIALALVVLAIVGALGIGALRLLRATSLGADVSSASRRGSVVGVVVDVVLVVLAIVALVALGTTGALQGHTDPVAAAAPGLIALGAAVVAVQIILLACRVGVRWTADSPAIASFLALRQTARRPGVLRQARVLVIALGLACFATAAWSVARTNRRTVADFQIGADRVVSVAPVGPTQLQDAVDHVDPHRRWAMATVQLQSTSTRLLAVQADRLAAVAAWPRAITPVSVTTAAARLSPPVAPEVDVPAGPIHITADASGSSIPHLNRTQLAAWVFSPAGGTAVVNLGPLRPATATYTTDLAAVCPHGCRLTGLGVTPTPGTTPPTQGTAQITIDTVTAGPTPSTISADLTPHDWRTSATGVTLHPDGLGFSATAAAITSQAGEATSTPPMISVADHPTVTPAVFTSELQDVNSGATGPLLTQGLDNTTLPVHPTTVATALPRVGGDALIVNLPLLARAQTNPTGPDTVDQVWLGPRAPRDAAAQLHDAGLTPTSTARASTVFNALQRTAPALADDFLLIAAAAALLVAAASTLGALGATTRERATELTSIRITGIPRPTLARALTLETLILLITAACGALAGTLAAILAVRSLPELTAPTLTPLTYALDPTPIVIVAAIVLATTALAATSITTILIRRMTPTLLRTAPDDVSG